MNILSVVLLVLTGLNAFMYRGYKTELRELNEARKKYEKLSAEYEAKITEKA